MQRMKQNLFDKVDAGEAFVWVEVARDRDGFTGHGSLPLEVLDVLQLPSPPLRRRDAMDIPQTGVPFYGLVVRRA